MGHKPREFYDPSLHNVDFASFLDRLNAVEQAVQEFEARLRALEEVVGGEGLGPASAAESGAACTPCPHCDLPIVDLELHLPYCTGWPTEVHAATNCSCQRCTLGRMFDS